MREPPVTHHVTLPGASGVCPLHWLGYVSVTPAPLDLSVALEAQRPSYSSRSSATTRFACEARMEFDVLLVFRPRLRIVARPPMRITVMERTISISASVKPDSSRNARISIVLFGRRGVPLDPRTGGRPHK